MKWLFFTFAVAAAAAVGVYAIHTFGGGKRDPEYVAAEKARATAYANQAGRDCSPPCRLFQVEPISPGMWRAHFGSATGYCMLIYLQEYRQRPGPDEGVDNTNCIGEPRPRP